MEEEADAPPEAQAVFSGNAAGLTRLRAQTNNGHRQVIGVLMFYIVLYCFMLWKSLQDFHSFVFNMEDGFDDDDFAQKTLDFNTL